MEHRRASLEDHIAMVSTGHSKTAAAKGEQDSKLLDKLAAELSLNEHEGAKEGAPVAEGETKPAASSPAGANSVVVGATDAVALPQVVARGGNIAAVMAGEVPATGRGTDGMISDGAGTVVDINAINKTPQAAAAAVSGKGGPVAEGEAVKEAELIGQKIAQSFQKEIEKQASDKEYAEALEFCKLSGLLEGYDIQDDMTKTASAPAEGFLVKIANNQPLTRADIVGAAYEYVELEKQAALAEAEGRKEANDLVDMITKVAAKAKKDEPETKAEKKAEEKMGEKAAEAAENEKVAALMQDPEVMGAVKVLKAKGLL